MLIIIWERNLVKIEQLKQGDVIGLKMEACPVNLRDVMADRSSA